MLNGTTEAVGIKFKPAVAYMFLPPSLEEIKNKTVTVSDLYTKLSREKIFSDKISIIEDWLPGSLLPGKNISDVVKKSLNIIHKHQGLLSIKSVVKRTNYNQRRIER